MISQGLPGPKWIARSERYLRNLGEPLDPRWSKEAVSWNERIGETRLGKTSSKNE